MLKNFKISELVILALTLIIIFISEYYFVVLGDHDRAIFIGLWPPTMLAFLIYINSKKNK